MEPVIETTRPLLDRQSLPKIGGFVLLYLYIILMFVAIGPTVFSSTWVSSSDFHACIEIASSFIAIIAALACLTYYFGLKNRFFLIIGLGFFICGGEDLVHGIFGFERLFEGSSADFSRFIPGTYVAGRSILAISIITAALLETRLKTTENIRQEAVIYSLLAVIFGGGATLLAFILPLPQLIYPEHLISRPVDLASAALYLIAFMPICKRFLMRKDTFSGMLLACILLNLGGQIYMSFSERLFDAFFDVAHWANILSYCMPVMGIVIQSLQDMRKSTRELEERKLMEVTLRGRTIELGERVKELNCLYGISHLIEQADISLEQVLQGTVDLIPPSWQYPEITCARIILGDKEFKTRNFRETVWKQSSEIVVDAERLGYLEVCYHEEMPESDEGPFLKEERLLINAIAGRLGTMIEQRRLNEALRNSESRIRTIVNTAVDGIITADSRGIITSFNPAAEKVFGYRAEELIGKNLKILMPSPYMEEHDTYLANYLQTGKRKIIGKGREAVAQRKDGTTFPLDLSVSEMRLGEERMFTGIIRDITERKVAEGELLKAKENAEEANKTKSEFLANMSHEIRTPMNSILGFTQLLLDEELSVSQQEMVETVKGSADRLLRLIDEILDLSKIEADSIVLEEVPFTMDSLVLEAIQLIRPRVAEKAVKIRFALEEGSQWVMGDPTRVRQVLLNLLANASKFTEQGEILTTVKTLEETKDRFLMEVAVGDTGIGISEDKLDTVFEVFTQADGSTTRKYGGTGLGLTISQRLINMMGGEIKVESRAGKGSTFRFSVWFKKGPAEAGPDKAPVETGEEKEIDRGFEILLVEDDLANQRMTMLMLEKMGHAVELAEDGVEAVEMAQTRTYDIILMDIQMPRMGGIEATEKLRQAGVSTPIVAMTASVMKGDRERLLEAGMDDYIAKPIRRDIVRDTLNRYVNRKSEQEIPDSDQMSLPSIKTITEELGLDQEQYLEILTGFIEEKKKDMEDLEKALAREDTELIARLAHKIKGSALNLRLDLMGKPAANIERAAKEGDLSGIAGDWDALTRGFEAIGGKGKRDGTST